MLDFAVVRVEVKILAKEVMRILKNVGVLASTLERTSSLYILSTLNSL